jgi:hypothetical protein
MSIGLVLMRKEKERRNKIQDKQLKGNGTQRACSGLRNTLGTKEQSRKEEG